MDIDKNKLVLAALKAREGSVSPYSKFKVGAAFLTRAGEMIGGANVESASYGLTCCAERIALFKALTEGRRDFIAVAVVARCDDGPMPCGACRQLLREYARKPGFSWPTATCRERLANSPWKELLPAAFVLVP